MVFSTQRQTHGPLKPCPPAGIFGKMSISMEDFSLLPQACGARWCWLARCSLGLQRWLTAAATAFTGPSRGSSGGLRASARLLFHLLQMSVCAPKDQDSQNLDWTQSLHAPWWGSHVSSRVGFVWVEPLTRSQADGGIRLIKHVKCAKHSHAKVWAAENGPEHLLPQRLPTTAAARRL